MDNKGTIPALGVALIGVALQTAAQIWPDMVKPHPYILFGFGIAGFTMLAFSLLRWAFEKKDTPAKSRTLSEIEVNPTINPNISPNFSPVFAPTFNANVQTPTKPMSSPAENPKASENLQSMGIIVISNEFFGEGSIFTLHIANELKNTPIDSAYFICANLTYMDFQGRTETIEAAYWIDHLENQITIHPGSSASIVLGRWHEHVWYLYKNSRSYQPGRNEWRRSGSVYAFEASSIDLDNGDLDLVVKVFSKRRGIVLLEDHYRVDSKSPILQRIVP